MSLTSDARASVAAVLRAGTRRLWPRAGASELLFTVDNVSARGRMVKGWGWTLHPGRNITAVTFLEPDEQRSGPELPRDSLAAHVGVWRPDVARRNPDLQDAHRSGFFLYGLLREPLRPSRELAWRVTFEDGEEVVVRTAPNVAFLPNEPWHLRSLLRRDGARIPRLLQGLRRVWHEQIAPHRVARKLADAGPVMLVFDHAMGGGANVFRRDFVEQAITSGKSCVCVTWSVDTLAFEVEVRFGTSVRAATFVNEAALWHWLDTIRVRHVYLNNIVSYPAPLGLLQRLVAFLDAQRAELTVLAHDFEAICPSWTLLDDSGTYCGIPADPGRCESCMRANNFLFKGALDQPDLAAWRHVWGGVLARAVEVRSFGDSSRELLSRAYPGLTPKRLSVVPHRLAHAHMRPVVSDIHAPLRIGVLGTIAYHKGSAVVQALDAAIRRRGLEARVIVVGTLESDARQKSITITGSYVPAQLPELLERHGINVCLFPSIWPETFSYVCEEIMHMGLPLVAFDLGAPASRVRKYPKGRVVPLCDADALLDAIVAFVAELRQR